MCDRHAYMIMAHHRIDLLTVLISALDDYRNDIIIHLDSKSIIDCSCLSTKFAKLFFIDRINVNWGGYSQVECEYLLLKFALNIGHHSYYHFLTGSTYPLWNQDYLHEFFLQNQGIEFIGFDFASDFYDRTKFFVPFSEHGKLKGLKGKFISASRKFCIILQKILKIDRNRFHCYLIKKGMAYFSITESFANYVVSKEDEIKKILKYTMLCDEVFIQTLAYNSSYKDKIYTFNNEFDGSLREFAWPSCIKGEHPGHNFLKEDLDYLLNSKRLFALKFESYDGIEIINIIKKKKKIS